MKYSDYYMKKNKIDASNYNFLTWIDTVENIIKQKIFFELLDLPDEDYISCWLKGLNPKEMSNIILKNNTDILF